MGKSIRHPSQPPEIDPTRTPAENPASVPDTPVQPPPDIPDIPQINPDIDPDLPQHPGPPLSDPESPGK
jgi:hypothetical protein